MINGLSMRRRVVGDIVGDLSSWLFGGGIIKNGTFRKKKNLSSVTIRN